MAMAVPARIATRFELCPTRPTRILTWIFALEIGTVREPRTPPREGRPFSGQMPTTWTRSLSPAKSSGFRV